MREMDQAMPRRSMATSVQRVMKMPGSVYQRRCLRRTMGKPPTINHSTSAEMAINLPVTCSASCVNPYQD